MAWDRRGLRRGNPGEMASLLLRSTQRRCRKAEGSAAGRGVTRVAANTVLSRAARAAPFYSTSGTISDASFLRDAATGLSWSSTTLKEIRVPLLRSHQKARSLLKPPTGAW